MLCGLDSIRRRDFAFDTFKSGAYKYVNVCLNTPLSHEKFHKFYFSNTYDFRV